MSLKQKTQANKNLPLVLTNQTLTKSSSDSDVDWATLTESDIVEMDTNSCNKSIYSDNSVPRRGDDYVETIDGDVEQTVEIIEIDENIIKRKRKTATLMYIIIILLKIIFSFYFSRNTN